MIEAKHVFDAVKLEDELAKELFSNYTEYLAEGIANIINILQPELVCIGGGVSKAGDMLLAPVKEKVAGKIFSKNSARNTTLNITSSPNPFISSMKRPSHEKSLPFNISLMLILFFALPSLKHYPSFYHLALYFPKQQ